MVCGCNLVKEQRHRHSGRNSRRDWALVPLRRDLRPGHYSGWAARAGCFRQETSCWCMKFGHILRLGIATYVGPSYTIAQRNGRLWTSSATCTQSSTLP